MVYLKDLKKKKKKKKKDLQTTKKACRIIQHANSDFKLLTLLAPYHFFVRLFSVFTIHVHADRNSESFQVHNSANANQKEKYEGDLKKEIKKLQVRTT